MTDKIVNDTGLWEPGAVWVLPPFIVLIILAVVFA